MNDNRFYITVENLLGIKVDYVCPRTGIPQSCEVNQYDFLFHTDECGYGMNDYLELGVLCEECKAGHTISLR